MEPDVISKQPIALKPHDAGALPRYLLRTKYGQDRAAQIAPDPLTLGDGARLPRRRAGTAKLANWPALAHLKQRVGLQSSGSAGSAAAEFPDELPHGLKPLAWGERDGATIVPLTSGTAASALRDRELVVADRHIPADASFYYMEVEGKTAKHMRLGLLELEIKRPECGHAPAESRARHNGARASTGSEQLREPSRRSSAARRHRARSQVAATARLRHAAPPSLLAALGELDAEMHGMELGALSDERAARSVALTAAAAAAAAASASAASASATRNTHNDGANDDEDYGHSGSDDDEDHADDEITVYVGTVGDTDVDDDVFDEDEEDVANEEAGETGEDDDDVDDDEDDEDDEDDDDNDDDNDDDDDDDDDDEEEEEEEEEEFDEEDGEGLLNEETYSAYAAIARNAHRSRRRPREFSVPAMTAHYYAGPLGGPRTELHLVPEKDRRDVNYCSWDVAKGRMSQYSQSVLFLLRPMDLFADTRSAAASKDRVGMLVDLVRRRVHFTINGQLVSGYVEMPEPRSAHEPSPARHEFALFPYVEFPKSTVTVHFGDGRLPNDGFLFDVPAYIDSVSAQLRPQHAALSPRDLVDEYLRFYGYAGIAAEPEEPEAAPDLLQRRRIREAIEQGAVGAAKALACYDTLNAEARFALDLAEFVEFARSIEFAPALPAAETSEWHAAEPAPSAAATRTNGRARGTNGGSAAVPADTELHAFAASAASATAAATAAGVPLPGTAEHDELQLRLNKALEMARDLHARAADPVTQDRVRRAAAILVTPEPRAPELAALYSDAAQRELMDTVFVALQPSLAPPRLKSLGRLVAGLAESKPVRSHRLAQAAALLSNTCGGEHWQW